jgi:hypothetical protein
MEVQIVKVSFSDTESNTSNKSDKSPPHEQESTQKEIL